MKRNYIKSILTLFTMAIVFGGAATANAQLQYRKALDFDGDGKADMTVIRGQNNPSRAVWYSRGSQNGALQTAQWGLNSGLDFEVPGDYDGDGKADYAIIRRQEPASVWYILPSGGGFRSVSFGTPNPSDIPVPADYDGDGKTDIAVVRSTGSTLTWYYEQSSNRQVIGRTLNRDPEAEYCKPQQGVDIDGDGKQDLTQVCKANGRDLMFWAVTRSTNNVVERYFFGILSANANDMPAPGDYDGDGKTDIAVMRRIDGSGNSSRYTWYVRRSSDSVIQSTQFGATESSYYDELAQADYDGDGKTDIAVWRSTVAAGGQSVFYILRSGSGNSLQVTPWGQSGDDLVTITTDFFTF